MAINEGNARADLSNPMSPSGDPLRGVARGKIGGAVEDLKRRVAPNGGEPPSRRFPAQGYEPPCGAGDENRTRVLSLGS